MQNLSENEKVRIAIAVRTGHKTFFLLSTQRKIAQKHTMTILYLSICQYFSTDLFTDINNNNKKARHLQILILLRAHHLIRK